MKKLKKATRLHHLTLTVVGFQYRLTDDELSALDERVDSQPVPCRLEREPMNEADPLAVKVQTQIVGDSIFENRYIGYVRRPANEALSKLLKRGVVVKRCELVFVDSKAGYGELELDLLKQHG